jgi:ATP-dependent RNA helicase RhlE
VRVEAAAPASTVSMLDQGVILVGSKHKREQLNKLLANPAFSRVIIFSRTKHGADRVTRNLLIDGHLAAAIHGNKSQNARQAALKAFAGGRARILVATDIAARGIDVPNISHVINYELPDDCENYVHRIGRTARNGASGTAITLASPEERAKLREIERLIRRTLPVVGEHNAAGSSLGDEMPASLGRSRRPEIAPEGKRGRSHAGKHRVGGNKPAIPAERGLHAGPAREKSNGPAWWERETGDVGAGTGARSRAKPRWTNTRKKAARAERRGENRRRPAQSRAVG